MRVLPQNSTYSSIGQGNGSILGPDGGFGAQIGGRLSESEIDRIAKLEKRIAALGDQVTLLTTHVQSLCQLPTQMQALLVRLGEA